MFLYPGSIDHIYTYFSIYLSGFPISYALDGLFSVCVCASQSLLPATSQHNCLGFHCLSFTYNHTLGILSIEPMAHVLHYIKSCQRLEEHSKDPSAAAI